MADALNLGVAYSSVQGRARSLPPGARVLPPHYSGRALLPSSWSAAFALPHPDKTCNYNHRGALPASTSDSGVGSTQLFNHYFEEEKNDGVKDHHDHRGAPAGAKMCRVGLATL